jgi:hypothetical protein
VPVEAPSARKWRDAASEVKRTRDDDVVFGGVVVFLLLLADDEEEEEGSAMDRRSQRSTSRAGDSSTRGVVGVATNGGARLVARSVFVSAIVCTDHAGNASSNRREGSTSEVKAP